MRYVALLAVAALPGGALADPPLGGPMDHIQVALIGDTVDLSLEAPGPMLLQDPGETYTGADSVLNDRFFNAQYGWLASGFWTLPPGASVWVESLGSTPGLDCYAGRTFLSYAQFDPLFGTDGSSPLMQWDGSMLHNYYAVDVPGDYEATYLVFIGDASAQPWPGYNGGTVTLTWTLPSAACSPADVTTVGAGVGDPGYGVPDGDITAADIQYYVNLYVTGDPAADMTTTGAGSGDPGYGVPDGAITAADIQFYVNLWVAGCP